VKLVNAGSPSPRSSSEQPQAQRFQLSITALLAAVLLFSISLGDLRKSFSASLPPTSIDIAYFHVGLFFLGASFGFLVGYSIRSWKGAAFGAVAGGGLLFLVLVGILMIPFL